MIFQSVLALALSVPVDPELKCPATHHLPGFPEGSAAMVIDGEVRGNNVDFDTSQLSPEDIGRLEIKCWDPETDALPAAKGVPLILISTNSALDAARSRALEAAQKLHSYESENGRLPASLDVLSPAFDGYRIEVGELGWTLIAPDVTDLSCSVSEVGLEAGEAPSCRMVYTAAKRSLREAWERGQQVF